MDEKSKNKFKFMSYNIVDKVEPFEGMSIFSCKGNIKFDPGQFYQISLPHLGEATFAPCSDPENHKSFEFCIRAAGSTSSQLVKLMPGDKLQIRGPYGRGWPLGKLIGKNIVIIVGGMGIVPIRPLIYELLRYRKEFKKLMLFAGFRTPHHVLFNHDLEEWKNKFDYFKVAVEKSEKGWWGEEGLITGIIEKVNFTPETIFLECGPDIMFKYVNEVLAKKEILDKQIYMSLERRMECGIGLCQHCSVGKYLVCRDGPVFRLDLIKDEIGK